MSVKRINFIILLILLFCTFHPTGFVQAIEYPIAFLSAQAGYGQNDLKSALAIKAAFRYSFEAYIPGLQIECGYSTLLFGELEDRTEKVKKDEENIYKTTIQDHQVGLSGLLQLRPFGKTTIIFIGGGGNINFLSCDSTWTEKYWDDVAEDYQELKHDPDNLYREIVPGYHVLGGLRFLLGKWGSLDFEVNQTYLNTESTEWKTKWAEEKYGNKKWDSLRVSVGLTINIF